MFRAPHTLMNTQQAHDMRTHTLTNTHTHTHTYIHTHTLLRTLHTHTYTDTHNTADTTLREQKKVDINLHAGSS